MTFITAFCSCLGAFILTLNCAYVKGDDDGLEQCSALTITGCWCASLGEIFRVTCNRETNIPTLFSSLDSAFWVNNTYEIELQNFSSVPSRVIQNLIVYRFIIDDKETVDIPDDVFDGVIRLRWFHVYFSGLTRIPKFEKVPHSLRWVNIDNSLLTRVQYEFQNLPLLVRLSLRNNVIESVHADAFRGSVAVQFLDLSFNRIVSLPENVFDELQDLKKLTLSHNRLYTVHGLLKNLGSKLRFLNLQYNNLTDADDILHPGLTSLDTLGMNNNPFSKLSATTFNGKVPALRFLSLDNCNFTEFRVEYFQNLSKLAGVDMSSNRIKIIGNDTMDFGHLFDLILNNNGIESFEGGISFRTKRLFLTDNKLTRLGNILQYTQLSEVDVSRNQLVALEQVDFLSAHGFENVAFRENKIARIEAQCFSINFRNSIHTLDLSQNMLTSLNRSVQYLSQLKALNVSYNFLEALDNAEFIGLNELSEMYMQGNRIVVLRGQIQNIPRLQYLILQNNTIHQLDITTIPGALQYFYIKDNPLNCNCELYLKFLSKLKENNSPELDWTPCQPTEVQEELPYEPCPTPCGCYCKSDVNVSFVNVDCSSRFLTSVPSALSNWSMFSNPPDGVYKIDDTKYTIYDRTLSVNLSDNRIDSLKGVNLSPNLKEVFLENNRLTTFPYSIMKLPKLTQATLSGNRWSCDCDDGRALKFRSWLLSKTSYVLDANKTRCYQSENKDVSGKVIISIAEADLCPNEIAMYITLTFSVLCLLLLIAAVKITYTRYEMNIKVWLYSKGVTWVKEKDIDRDKRFDAFLSFSHMDSDFVTEAIIDELEARCPNINLCIHYRHFVPGKFIHENIIDAVNNSKRTVLILTKNFLESEWCMMEFRAADVQNIKDKVRRVIVIKLGDLPSDLDPNIKIYLDSTTYLTWGEKYFWQKLIYALPTPSPYSITTQSTMTLLS